ncbi:MAG: translocation/assembly module TamB domain-containing protein [Bacteroidales bacterium]|nr:translocation/assembly module TamB domain-containing protein [Bacteroidales bacterium]
MAFFIIVSPIFQNLSARIATRWLSRELKTEIYIRNIRFVPLKSLLAEDVLVRDLNGDTLLFSKRMLLKMKWIAVRERAAGLSGIRLEKTILRLCRDETGGPLNLDFLLDYFQGDDTVSTGEPWQLRMSRIRLTDCSFSLDDRSEEPVKSGMDFSHLDFAGINLDLEDIGLAGDSVTFSINDASFREGSGFELQQLSGRFLVNQQQIIASGLGIATPSSSLHLDLAFTFGGWQDFGNFLEAVKIDADIRNSVLRMSDIGFFAPALAGMDNDLEISGILAGTVSKFKSKELRVAYGERTRIDGDIRMTGLPDVEATFIHAQFRELVTDAKDIRNFIMPEGRRMGELPEMLDRFGSVHIKGNFTGFYNDFVSYALFDTDLGSIRTDVALRLSISGEIGYSGRMDAHRIDLGSLIAQDIPLGRMSLHADIAGTGVKPGTARISVTGEVDSLEFYDYVYQKIGISGEWNAMAFTGKVTVFDENAGLDFDGLLDFSGNIPKYDFTASVRDARLSRLNLFKADSLISLSTRMRINIMGSHPDEMQGMISIDSTRYIGEAGEVCIENLTLSVTREMSEYMVLRLFSDFADASLEGKVVFRELGADIQRLFDAYADTLVPDTLFAERVTAGQDFNFELKLKDVESVASVFAPGWMIAPDAKLTGGFNSFTSNLHMSFSLPEIRFGDRRASQLTLNGNTIPTALSLDVEARELFYTDTLNVESFKMNTTVRHDSINYRIGWDNRNQKIRNAADITGFVRFISPSRFRARIHKAQIIVNDEMWEIDPENMLLIDTTYLMAKRFHFKSGEQKIFIDGAISENPSDTLTFEFGDFRLSNFDLLTSNLNIDLDGKLTGRANINDIYHIPGLDASIFIRDFHFNRVLLGDLTFSSTWRDLEKAFYLNTSIIYTGNIGTNEVLRASGYYYTGRSDRNFDLGITLNNYKIRTLAPFLSSFSSGWDGLASGNLRLAGTAGMPDLTGQLSLIHTKFRIDYLNVIYYTASTLVFQPDRISLDDMILYDSLNNQAHCSGYLKHDHFSNLSFDIQAKMEGLACLNTTRSQNELFFGKAQASGQVRIAGDPENIDMDIQAALDKGTQMVIPISYDVDIYENDYIVFITKGDDKEDRTEPPAPVVQGLSLRMNIEARPAASIEIILPYEMGRIKASGTGDILMAITRDGSMTMNGRYTISRGSFFFTLQNIINRYFDVRSGSSVVWTGDPYDADIDISAVYKVKTALGAFAPEGDSAARVPVECVINMRNKLANPELRFMIEFPDMRNDTREYIYAQLDTNDQAQMSQQMLSLLITNSFSQPSGYSSGVGFNSFTLVSNQLNQWLSQVSDNIDIGINYLPGDKVSEDEVELALSTQLFDNRVTIDGNVGVRGENNASTKNTNSIVGEVMVEVKITRDGRFRIRAFNKSNSDYFYKNYSPYTQGVGVFYTKEFNRLSELIRKKGNQDAQRPEDASSIENN